MPTSISTTNQTLTQLVTAFDGEHDNLQLRGGLGETTSLMRTSGKTVDILYTDNPEKSSMRKFVKDKFDVSIKVDQTSQKEQAATTLVKEALVREFGQVVADRAFTNVMLDMYTQSNRDINSGMKVGDMRALYDAARNDPEYVGYKLITDSIKILESPTAGIRDQADAAQNLRNLILTSTPEEIDKFITVNDPTETLGTESKELAAKLFTLKDGAGLPVFSDTQIRDTVGRMLQFQAPRENDTQYFRGASVAQLMMKTAINVTQEGRIEKLTTDFVNQINSIVNEVPDFSSIFPTSINGLQVNSLKEYNELNNDQKSITINSEKGTKKPFDKVWAEQQAASITGRLADWLGTQQMDPGPDSAMISLMKKIEEGIHDDATSRGINPETMTQNIIMLRNLNAAISDDVMGPLRNEIKKKEHGSQDHINLSVKQEVVKSITAIFQQTVPGLTNDIQGRYTQERVDTTMILRDPFSPVSIFSLSLLGQAPLPRPVGIE